jgi:hypothetical protein
MMYGYHAGRWGIEPFRLAKELPDMAAAAEQVVRTYLAALRNPDSLRDDDSITKVEQQLADADDPIERLHLHEQLAGLHTPSLGSIEEDFIAHAKAWADEAGITDKAFTAEGVDADVLRKAGFSVAGGGRRGGRRSGGSAKTPQRRQSSGKRVTTEQVVAAMPKKAFTVKQLQEASGASMAVVRKAIAQQIDAGTLSDAGKDTGYSGPGRSPTLYKRA